MPVSKGPKPVDLIGRLLEKGADQFQKIAGRGFAFYDSLVSASKLFGRGDAVKPVLDTIHKSLKERDDLA